MDSNATAYAIVVRRQEARQERIYRRIRRARLRASLRSRLKQTRAASLSNRRANGRR